MNRYNPAIHHRKSIRLKGYDYTQAGLYFVTICCQDNMHMYGHIKNGKMILNKPGVMVKKWYYELENKFPDIKCHEMVVMPNHFHCIIENIGHVTTNATTTTNATASVPESVTPNETATPTVGADLCVCPNPPQPSGNQPMLGNQPTQGRQYTTDGKPLSDCSNTLDGKSSDGKPLLDCSNILDGQSSDGKPLLDGLNTLDGKPLSDGSNTLDKHPMSGGQPTSGEHMVLGEHTTLGEHIGSPLHRVVGWFKTMSTNEYIRGVKTKQWKRFDGKLWQRNYWEHIIRNETSYNNISNYIVNNPSKWEADRFNSSK